MKIRILLCAGLGASTVVQLLQSEAMDLLAAGLREIAVTPVKKPKLPEDEQKKVNEQFLQAIKNNDLDAIKRTLEAGADLLAKNEYGTSSLDFAIGLDDSSAAHQQYNIVRYLIEQAATRGLHIDINERFKDGTTHAHYAAQSGNIELIDYLANIGADFNAKEYSRGESGRLPTDFVKPAKKGLIRHIRYIAYAQLSKLSKEEQQKLNEQLLSSKTVDEAKKALSSGANSYAVDEYGKTIMHYAAEAGNKDLVAYLMTTDAKNIISTPEMFGRRPLHYAAWSGNKELFQYLMENKDAAGDINEKDNHRKKPLDYALESGNSDLIIYMIENTQAVNDIDENAMHYAVQSGNRDLVKYFIEKARAKKYINSEGAWGMQPLHMAAATGSKDVVQYLIEQTGAARDINSADRRGMTPLHFAAGASKDLGALDLIEYLITKTKAVDDVNKKDENGLTPLDIQPKIADYLKGKGI